MKTLILFLLLGTINGYSQNKDMHTLQVGDSLIYIGGFTGGHIRGIAQVVRVTEEAALIETTVTGEEREYKFKRWFWRIMEDMTIEPINLEGSIMDGYRWQLIKKREDEK